MSENKPSRRDGAGETRGYMKAIAEVAKERSVSRGGIMKRIWVIEEFIDEEWKPDLNTVHETRGAAHRDVEEWHGLGDPSVRVVPYGRLALPEDTEEE